MKNKILIGTIIVLAAALIFENAYLLGRHNRERFARRHYYPSRAVRPRDTKLPIFYETHLQGSFVEANKMQEKMNRMFENNFYGLPASKNINTNKRINSSSVSFSNTNSAYLVKVAMPGVDKDAINIQVKGRQLIISAKDSKDKTNEDKNSYSQESSYSNFMTSLTLPEDAKVDNITSDYKDGVLTINIPREQKDGIASLSTINVPVK